MNWSRLRQIVSGYTDTEVGESPDENGYRAWLTVYAKLTF